MKKSLLEAKNISPKKESKRMKENCLATVALSVMLVVSNINYALAAESQSINTATNTFSTTYDWNSTQGTPGTGNRTYDSITLDGNPSTYPWTQTVEFGSTKVNAVNSLTVTLDY